jgi:hypothetical protein
LKDLKEIVIRAMELERGTPGGRANIFFCCLVAVLVSIGYVATGFDVLNNLIRALEKEPVGELHSMPVWSFLVVLVFSIGCVWFIYAMNSKHGPRSGTP